MKNILRWGVLVAALAGGASAMGCTANADVTAGDVPPRTGSVTVRWSVDGSFDPAACDAFAAFDARIDVYDESGQPVFTQFTDCRAFSATIDLFPARYSARIEMVDSRQQARSTSIPISSFTIIADTNLVLDTDFPRNSFF
ncbi:MAG: hypothetical protein ACXWUG_11165 [Polyangiales bacterium]